MKNDNSKMVGRRLIRSYLTSVISISLVLFLVAMALFAWANTKILSNYFKSFFSHNIHLSCVLVMCFHLIKDFSKV